MPIAQIHTARSLACRCMCLRAASLTMRRGGRIAIVALMLLAVQAATTAQGLDALSAFRFIENRGQWDPRACYMLDRGPMRVWMARDEVVYALSDGAGRGHILRQRFAGAASVTPVADRMQPGLAEFSLGDRSAHDVPAFAELRYNGLYRGIDALYHQSSGALEYDLLVAPGADPDLIRFSYDGADGISIAPDGSLEIATSVGTMREAAPYCYQVVGGERRSVACRFVRDERGIGFAVGEYDRGRGLVIDPTLIYSSYLGGNRSDAGRGITLDAAGNMYVTGTTLSDDFPPLSGPVIRTATTAIFVAKLDPTGSALLRTYFIDGNGADEPVAIRVRTDGVVLIAGTTFSTDFPFVNGAYRRPADVAVRGDGFVLGLNADFSSIRFSTYFGGGDSDRVEDMVLGNGNTVFITGWTRSADMPMLRAKQSTPSGGADAFVAQFTDNCSTLLSSTYMGGTDDDRATAIATEPGGAVWIAGSSTSPIFLPAVTNGTTVGPLGQSDCFVVRIWFEGTGGDYKAMIGGEGRDEARAIAVVDGPGTTDTVIITGRTTSTQYPTTPPGERGAWFVTELIGTDGTVGFSHAYSDPNDGGSGMAVQAGADRNIYVCGTTTMGTFLPAAVLKGPRGRSDVAFVRLDPVGTFIDAIVVGGEGNDVPWHEIHLSPLNDLYATGVTSSARFPYGRNAIDTILNADRRTDLTDAFVLRVGFKRHPAISGRTTFAFDTLHCDTTSIGQFYIYNTGDSALVIKPNSISPENGFTLIQPDPQGVDADTLKPGDSLLYRVRFISTKLGSATDTLVINSNDPLLKTPFKVALTAVRSVPTLTVPGPLAFGPVLTCLPGGITRQIHASNGGISGLHVLSVTRSQGDASFQVGPIATPLDIPKNGSLNLPVSFKPQHVGLITDTILIRVQECGAVFRIPISGIGDTASVAFTPAELSFGALPLCVSSSDSSVTLTNHGAATLHFAAGQSPVISAEFTRTSVLPDSIKAGESITIKIGFHPLTGTGTATATLHLQFVECGLAADLALRGERTSAATLEASLGAVEFGAIVGCPGAAVSAQRSIVLRNHGSGPITITIDLPPGAFAVADTAPAPIVVNGGDSTAFTVRFEPAVPGSSSGMLSIAFVAGPCSDTLRIPLSGSREQIHLDAPVTTVDFPPLLACDRSADTTLAFNNHSSSPITIDSVRTTDGAAHVGPIGFPRVIPAGGSLDVHVAFRPKDTGDVVEHLTYFLGPCGDSVVITLRGRTEGRAYRFREDRIDFPPQLACATVPAADSFLLHNTGKSIPIAVRSVRVIGDTAFRVDTSIVERVIGAGDSLHIPVRFTATAAGTFSAVVEMVLEPCGDTVRREVAASLIEPALHITGGSFGDVRVGTHATGQLVIRNDKPVPIRVGALDGIAAPFSVTAGGLPVTLAPGDSVVLDLDFFPSDTLAYAPTAQAVTSLPCLFSQAVQLSGRGIAAPATGDVFCLDTIVAGFVGEIIELRIGTTTPGHALPAPSDITYWLGYDPNLLQLIGVGPAPRVTVGGGSVADGTVRIDEHAAVSVGPDEIRVRFRLLLGRDPVTVVRLDSARMAQGDAALGVCRAAAMISIFERCVLTNVFRGKFPNRLEDVTPNPSGTTAEVTYQQLEDARAVLSIFDMSGREVLRPLDAVLTGGRYTVRFDVAGLPAGAYLYSLTAGTFHAAKKMMVGR